MELFTVVDFTGKINFTNYIPVYFEIATDPIKGWNFVRGWFSDEKPKVITCVMFVTNFTDVTSLELADGKGTFKFVTCSDVSLLDFITNHPTFDVYGLVECTLSAYGVTDPAIDRAHLTMSKDDVIRYIRKDISLYRLNV